MDEPASELGSPAQEHRSAQRTSGRGRSCPVSARAGQSQAAHTSSLEPTCVSSPVGQAHVQGLHPSHKGRWWETDQKGAMERCWGVIRTPAHCQRGGQGRGLERRGERSSLQQGRGRHTTRAAEGLKAPLEGTLHCW